MSEKVIAWWGIPCKSVIPIFRELNDSSVRDVRFVALYPLPERRRRLGWGAPPSGSLPVEILADDGWQRRIDELVMAHEGIHLINGIYHNPRVRYLAKRLLHENRRFGVIAEAPSNLEVGWRRIAKRILAPIVIPLRSWGTARRAMFVLSQSGNVVTPFMRMGFRKDRILPFGYFPEYAARLVTESSKKHLSLLCIGYLEPFKGQDVLLRAIALLRDRGVSVSATITGYGSALEQLLSLRSALGLANSVEFTGVVSDERLRLLFAESSALVAPGLEEPWGIRVNEGLLALLPVIVSDGIGAKELVLATQGGEVFRSGSPESLAAAVVRLAARLETGELQLALENGRPKIVPEAAARYLDSVLRWANAGFLQGTPPAPPWLAGASCAPQFQAGSRE